MYKKFNLLIIAIVMTLIGLLANEASGDYICGDANGDTSVNVADAVWIINYVFAGGDPPDPLKAGDANCDLTCNVADAVWIINYIFAGGFAACDPDGNGIPNRAPVCSLPSSETYIICADTTFVFPIPATDEDGNLSGCMKVSGIGIFDGGNWTFTTTGEGVYTGIFECMDSCGATCTDTADITVTLNAPPICNLPLDTSFFVCADTTFSFSILASDVDGNLDSCALISGDGSFDGSYWTFTTTGEGVYTGIFECVDSCGVTCTDTVDITVTQNSAPVCNLPNDTTYNICGDTSFVFSVSATDEDGNLSGCVQNSGVGSFDGTNWSFAATEGGVYSASFVCTDACEASCSGTVAITVEHCTVTDIDGNVYQTVKIGDQCWMAENLKVTHYRNGDAIPHVTDGGTWSGLSTGAYCNYANNESYVATYGRLYNWYAVDDSRNIAPAGWHVPSDAELKQLEMYLGMSQAEADAVNWRGTDEGGKLKEAGTTHWNPPNTGATNESGFTALPGGYRLSNGNFSSMGGTALFWSSTEYSSYNAWGRGLSCMYSQVARGNYDGHYGFSVRCVRD